MNQNGTSKCVRNIALRIMGLVVAPLSFTIVICGILLLIANVTVGDIIGYGSLLLMDKANPNHNISDLFVPLDPDVTLPDKPDTLDIRDITFPIYEQVYGEISIPSVGILDPFIYGDTTQALKKGVCQFIGSSIVGYGGTTLACAHINRHFKNLHKVQLGDLIHIRTTYGAYTYEVRYIGIHDAKDDSVYDLTREDENLVLYTCYYENTKLGSVKKRLFVCADYVSGPMIVDGGNSK